MDELLRGVELRSERAKIVEAWLQWRDARLAVAVGSFEAREPLLRRVSEPSWRHAIEETASRVHLVALTRLERALDRFERLESLKAPAVVLENERAQISEALAALPADAPWPSTKRVELLGLSHFLELMVVAAQAEQTSFGEGSFDRDSEVTLEVEPDEPELIRRGTTLGHWLPARFALPRLVSRREVWPRMEASGPVSWALAGDPPGPELADASRQALEQLGPDEVLVSFVWKDDSVAGPWEPVLRT